MTNPTCPHCGTAIGEHEANACLDKWVAETVMGWQWLPTPDPEGQHYCWVKDGCEIGDFEPSSDISAAWEVVEKYPVGKWTWSIRQVDDGKWWVTLKRGSCASYSHPKLAGAKSAPLAICRAAVLAAGEKP